MNEPVIDKEREWYEREIRRRLAELKDAEANRDLYLRRWNEEIAKRDEAVVLVKEGMELVILLKAIIEGHEAAMREAIEQATMNPYHPGCTRIRKALRARLKEKP